MTSDEDDDHAASRDLYRAAGGVVANPIQCWRRSSPILAMTRHKPRHNSGLLRRCRGGETPSQIKKSWDALGQTAEKFSAMAWPPVPSGEKGRSVLVDLGTADCFNLTA